MFAVPGFPYGRWLALTLKEWARGFRKSRPPAAGRTAVQPMLPIPIRDTVPTLVDRVQEHDIAAAVLAKDLINRMRSQAAATLAAPMTFTVLVIDMFHEYEDDCSHAVEGFGSLEVAREYARRRTWDSVEEVREPGRTHDEMRRRWVMFGESCSVMNGGYSGYDELDYLIDHPAEPWQRNWRALEPGSAPQPTQASKT